MNARSWMLATISEDAPRAAAQYGLGLEIDEFCTAENMDRDFEKWNEIVLSYLKTARAEVFHAPFAEMYPCAVDPRIRAVAMDRMRQAASLALSYGIRRMVAHGGFLPNVYFPQWYEPRSAEFWREFLSGQPEDFELLIENVLEDDPASMARMADAIGDDRAGLCLDVGHANAVSPIHAEEWIRVLGPRVRHVHLHNNHGERDEHNPPDAGTLCPERLLALLDEYAPGASITLECPDALAAARWLKSRI